MRMVVLVGVEERCEWCWSVKSSMGVVVSLAVEKTEVPLVYAHMRYNGEVREVSSESQYNTVMSRT